MSLSITIDLSDRDLQHFRDAMKQADAAAVTNGIAPTFTAEQATRGKTAYDANCVSCHGSGAAGAVGGYPNLNDDEWLWGGKPEDIRLTIAHGVRFVTASANHAMTGLTTFPFPVFDPATIDFVLLTHAHIDHTGYLPKLVKEGFEGPIYCTFPTMELTKILLLDSAKLQEEEAAYAQKKGYSRHEKPQPLYTKEDAEKVFPLLQPIYMEQEEKIDERISFTYYNAGHILGAAILKVKVKGENQEKKIVFSGDLGRYHDPIFNPPARVPFADILLCDLCDRYK